MDNVFILHTEKQKALKFPQDSHAVTCFICLKGFKGDSSCDIRNSTSLTIQQAILAKCEGHILMILSL